ncbi:hypothetical protein [Chryseobacterium arachidis]|uniref:hypothetical protein n=1 Tax=Chryseobacterium arachidis TaxID=1416778 RepID=UPI0015B5B9E3|nr:hypothetical protein [Chryseobacterium arachidis]
MIKVKLSSDPVKINGHFSLIIGLQDNWTSILLTAVLRFIVMGIKVLALSSEQ